MSDNNRSTNPTVEIPVVTQWYVGPIVTGLMLILIILIYIFNPTFKAFEGFVPFIIIFAIFEVVTLGISLLRKNITIRISVNSPSQSLVFEEFWSQLRMSKKIYPYETIKRFEIVYRIMNKGRYSTQQVEVAALVFQSGKMKYLTKFRDRENAQTTAIQLNNLLQDHGGFPSERFAEPLVPYLPARTQKALKGLACFILLLISAVIIIVILMLTNSL
ncbi:MAG: hypothetical protein KAR20_08065 [Candidatus Heimdallarchaeota archaeon]|nr:hypothetical protein [Candidatus Heimdallarchaeota archaeon]